MALLRAADLQLDVVLGQVVHPLLVAGDVGEQPAEPVGQVVDVGGHQHLRGQAR